MKRKPSATKTATETTPNFMLETLRLGFKNLSVNLWIPTISYIVLSIVPLILGIEMASKLKDVADNSLILNTLVDKFDFAIFTDFWRLNQAKLYPILRKAIWTLPLIWLLKVFITGGTVDAVNDKTFSMNRYFKQCIKYFWRMFRLDILQFFLILVTLVIGVLILWALLGDIDGKNEIQLFYRIAPVVCTFFLLYFLFAICKDYTAQKIYFSGSHNVRSSFFSSFKYIFSNPKLIIFQVLLYIFGLVWLWMYLLLDTKINGTGMGTSIVIVCSQQLYVLGKHFLRSWHLFIVQIVQDKRAIS